MKKKISITISEHLINAVDDIVDNLFIRNRSQGIEYLMQKAIQDNKTAVILAGGSDQTMIKNTNKYRMTAKIGKTNVAEEQVKALREQGFKKIFIVARSALLTKAFEILKNGSGLGVDIKYIEEKESKGTAHSLKLLKGRINSSFLVVYGDILFNKVKIEDLWGQHIKSRALTTLMITTSPNPSVKGCVELEGTKIVSFIQRPKKSDVYLVFSPIIVCEPEIFEYEEADELETELFPLLAKRGLLMGYISSVKEFHIHELADTKKAKFYI